VKEVPFGIGRESGRAFLALGEMALSARGTKGDAYNFVYRIK
jgi:hypothetical protein